LLSDGGLAKKQKTRLNGFCVAILFLDIWLRR